MIGKSPRSCKPRVQVSGRRAASHEHNEQYYKDRAPGRKVFADQHGGGASSVGFSDGGGGGLSAALSPGKAGKKAVARSPPKQESRAHGRKHGNFERDALDAGALLGGRETREAPYHDERPRVTFADETPAASQTSATKVTVSASALGSVRPRNSAPIWEN